MLLPCNCDARTHEKLLQQTKHLIEGIYDLTDACIHDYDLIALSFLHKHSRKANKYIASAINEAVFNHERREN